jgi:hypothetical protein
MLPAAAVIIDFSKNMAASPEACFVTIDAIFDNYSDEPSRKIRPP